MKKKTISIILIILGVIIAIAAYLSYRESFLYKGEGLWEEYEIQEATIADKKMRLVVADTQLRHAQGLMFVRKPVKGFDGMVFYFPDAQQRSFWNQNTYVDLKLYWMRDGAVIGTSDLPSIERNGLKTVQSPGPADTVVEEIL